MTIKMQIWDYFKKQGFTDAGVAGIMGNFYAESLFIPNNLQDSYEVSLGYTNESYTEAVDNGTYDNFVYDSAGYGLAQWTYYSRKEGLLNLAKERGVSISDLQLQLDYFLSELQGYNFIIHTLKTTTEIKTPTIQIMMNVEVPADQSSSAQFKRIQYAQRIFDECVTAYSEIKQTEDLVEVKNSVDSENILILAKEVHNGKWGDSWQESIINSISLVLEEIEEIVATAEAESDNVPFIYTVQSGDTLTAIANKYNTSIEKILQDNQKDYPTMTEDFIKIGWTLKINN